MIDALRNERLRKLSRLNEEGIIAYPARVKRTSTIQEVLSSFAQLKKNKKTCTVVGRVTGMRKQGALIFLDIKDENASIQFVLKRDKVKRFALYKETLDIGDFVSGSGIVFKTKNGERSVEINKFDFISKSLRPTPSDWYGLKDVEVRSRKRYLDILLNPDVQELFRKKAIFWNTMRTYLLDNDFLEVYGSALENIPGGADAEPFMTHHNSLDTDFYLRISLELPLKRLIVGGYEKVFEIGRIFRNEGIDAEHLQDYLQMEMYWAYQDYNGLMKFIEALTKKVIKKTTGSLTTVWENKNINWNVPWKRFDYYDLFQKHTQIDLTKATREELMGKARELAIQNMTKNMSRGRLIDLIFKHTVRPTLIQPGFLIDPPIEIEPLAKRTEYDTNRVERFQIVACGTELGKGFSELNDPLDQKKRFEEQMKLREMGDKEAQMIDEDYIEAMEYGMPPTAGFGISERFFAILMNRPVRETTLFPLMKKRKQHA